MVRGELETWFYLWSLLPSRLGHLGMTSRTGTIATWSLIQSNMQPHIIQFKIFHCCTDG